jgi:hypothetical protein
MMYIRGVEGEIQLTLALTQTMTLTITLTPTLTLILILAPANSIPYPNLIPPNPPPKRTLNDIFYL